MSWIVDPSPSPLLFTPKMAFDDAPSRGGGGFGDREIRRAVAQPGAGVSGGGLARGSSSRAPASYQNAGASAWTTVCGRVEEELRRFATLTSTLKKNVDTLGTPRDSEDVRTKITAAVARGKEAVTDISGLLKTNLAEAGATDDASLSQMERTARKTQQQRFEKDWMAASAAYKEVRWLESSGVPCFFFSLFFFITWPLWRVFFFFTACF